MALGILIALKQWLSQKKRGQTGDLYLNDAANEKNLSFPSHLIVNPSHVEGKILSLGNLPYFKRKWLYHSITKQRRRDGYFTHTLHLGHGVNTITFKDEVLEQTLCAYFDRGKSLPNLYSLDDLFFKAAKHMGLLQHSWLFIVRQEKEQTYALCCYQGDAFLFKRILPKTMLINDEILTSKVFMKRFGYAAGQPVQLLFFSNYKVTLHGGGEGAEDLIPCKRIPFDRNQVINIGLKTKPLAFMPPLIQSLFGPRLLTLLRRVSTVCVAPLCLVAGVLFLGSRYMHDEGTLMELNSTLQKAEVLPENATHFKIIDENNTASLAYFQEDTLFWKTLRGSLGPKIYPDSIHLTLREKKIILSFNTPVKTALFNALKKAFPHYNLTLAPHTVTFVPVRVVTSHQGKAKRGIS